MKNAFFYFIIFPFYGLIQAIRNYTLSWAKNMVWLFVVFYGYTMYRPEAMDSTRYVNKLQELYNSPKTWSSFISSFYSLDERGQGSVDLYEPIVTNFISLFTDNGNVLYAFFGLVFGYFFSRNLWFLVDEIKTFKGSRVVWFLFFVFISIIGFWELNGVRMWTAAHVFFFGSYLVLMQNKKKGIYFVLGSMLFHFAFALPVALFVFYYFTRITWRILYFLFIASFFVSFLNVTTVASFLENNLPELLLPRVKSYTSDLYVEVYEDIRGNTNWYIEYSNKVIDFILAILITLIYFSRTKIFTQNKQYTLYIGFTLLLLTLGNLLAPLPSGMRYLLLAELFGMSLLVYHYCNYSSIRYRRMVGLLSPFLLFFIIISLRKSFDTVSIMTVFTNPVLATIFDSKIPLIDLIK